MLVYSKKVACYSSSVIDLYQNHILSDVVIVALFDIYLKIRDNISYQRSTLSRCQSLDVLSVDRVCLCFIDV